MRWSLRLAGPACPRVDGQEGCSRQYGRVDAARAPGGGGVAGDRLPGAGRHQLQRRRQRIHQRPQGHVQLLADRRSVLEFLFLKLY